MGILREMVRNLSKEANLMSDVAPYNVTVAAWTIAHDYGNIVLSEAGMVAFTIKYYNSGPTGDGAVRLSIGGKVVFAVRTTSITEITAFGMVYLAAGTYNVLAEGYKISGTSIRVQNFQLGKFFFSDTDGEALQAYSAELGVTLAARKTPLGIITHGTLYVMASASTPAAVTNFENVGDSLPNGVDLLIDGVQVNWSSRQQDASPYGYGYAYHVGYATTGSTHTIIVTKDNADTVVNISVVFCPWVLWSSEYWNLIDFEFPEGSTIYVTLEPFMSDVSKTLRIGAYRGIDLGEFEWYYTSSGTGILNCSYSFEILKVSGNLLVVTGWGGCVSILAVDLR
jgi:hypothetical protein